MTTTDADRKLYRRYLVIFIAVLILIPYTTYFLKPFFEEPMSDTEFCVQAQVEKYLALKKGDGDYYRSTYCGPLKIDCDLVEMVRADAAFRCLQVQRPIINN